ncbi:hypothetical protein U91I_00909 [alpha proteobacterium U9-1i]|nr:hypothetical protein U91I_00909 [alpha proteobacterium U9-1i]
MQRDILFLLSAPFEDKGEPWFCASCAMLEGALFANPHWSELIDVRRVAYPRPRDEVIALIGVENQSLPVLVLPEGAPVPAEAKIAANGRAFLDDPKAISRHLVAIYGGAGPHP